MSGWGSSPAWTQGVLGVPAALSTPLGSAPWALAFLAGAFVARLHLRSFERSVRQLLEADRGRGKHVARAPRFLITVALLYGLQQARLPWSAVGVGVFVGLVWGRVVMAQRISAERATAAAEQAPPPPSLPTPLP